MNPEQPEQQPQQKLDPKTQAMVEAATMVEEGNMREALIQHLQGRVVALNVEVRRVMEAHAELQELYDDLLEAQREQAESSDAASE